MACRFCAKRAIHPDDAVEIMEETGHLRPKVPYVRVDKPWLGECMRCHQVVEPRLHDVMNGQGACVYWAPNTPLTNEQAWDRALSYRFRPNDPDAFKSTNDPWPGTCASQQAGTKRARLISWQVTHQQAPSIQTETALGSWGMPSSASSIAVARGCSRTRLTSAFGAR